MGTAWYEVLHGMCQKTERHLVSYLLFCSPEEDSGWARGTRKKRPKSSQPWEQGKDSLKTSNNKEPHTN